MISPEVLTAAVESPYFPETIQSYKRNIALSLDPLSPETYYEDCSFLHFRFYQLVLKNIHSQKALILRKEFF